MCPNTEIAGRIPKLLVAPMPVPGFLWIMFASPILKGEIIMSSEPPHDSEWSVTMGTQHSLLSVAAMRSQHQHFNGRWGLTITSHKLTTISASLQIIMIITVTHHYSMTDSQNQQILINRFSDKSASSGGIFLAFAVPEMSSQPQL